MNNCYNYINVKLEHHTKKDIKNLLQKIENNSNILWRSGSTPTMFFPNQKYLYLILNIEEKILYSSQEEKGPCVKFSSFLDECIRIAPIQINENGYLRDYPKEKAMFFDHEIKRENLSPISKFYFESFSLKDNTINFASTSGALTQKGKNKMNSEKVTIKTTMTSCVIGILAPMATKENTSIHADEKNNKLFVAVAAKENEAFEDVDFSFETEIPLNEKYDASSCEASISNGTIIITVKTRKDIRRIEIS